MKVYCNFLLSFLFLSFTNSLQFNKKIWGQKQRLQVKTIITKINKKFLACYKYSLCKIDLLCLKLEDSC